MRNLNVALSDETAASFDAFPPDTQTQIQQQINAFATAFINQRKADTDGFNGVDAEDAAWWRSLTPEEQDQERAIILRSMAEGDAGRTKPAEEVYARLRAKFADKKATL